MLGPRKSLLTPFTGYHCSNAAAKSDSGRTKSLKLQGIAKIAKNSEILLRLINVPWYEDPSVPDHHQWPIHTATTSLDRTG